MRTSSADASGQSLLKEHKLPLVVLVGPTAVGKTEIAIQVAERMDGEIVSADSRLFYRGMNIGTAKPDEAELKRVPHHLINVTNPDEPWNLSIFQQEARKAIARIHGSGHLPFLVGGSGQYIRAVVENWTPPEVKPDDKIRSRLEKLGKEKGAEWLFDFLKKLDPLSAENIQVQNQRRSIRALEVILSTGRRFSEQRQHGEAIYQLFTIGLNRQRPELYARIDKRIDAMFAAGLLDEVKGLLEKGYSPSLPSLSAIGYRESIRVLNGEMTREQAVTEMKKLTRIYVRRQANWFKTEDPSITWFSVNDTTMEDIIRHLQQRMCETGQIHEG